MANDSGFVALNKFIGTIGFAQLGRKPAIAVAPSAPTMPVFIGGCAWEL
jgi:hypothetical protein